MKFAYILIVILFCSTQANAQAFNQNLKMSNWKIRVEANQFTAKTVMELTFCNTNLQQEAEAYYEFNLKAHQAITHFELMLGDKYRDASIEERWKANNTYNSIVGKRIDPAVLQKKYGSLYSVNIYPVAVKECRSIRITIEEKLPIINGQLIYCLPLVHHNKVDNLEVIFSTDNKIDAISTGILKSKELPAQTISFKNRYNSINDSIRVPMLVEKSKPCIVKQDSIYRFAYRIPNEYNMPQEFKPKSITAFWDLSMAARYHNFGLDVDFIKKYMQYHQINSVEVIGFNHELIFKDVYTINELHKLLERFRTMKLIGASNLNVVVANKINTDVAFVFSRGTSAYNKNIQSQQDVPIFAVFQEKSISHVENLNKLISGSGGITIELHKDRLGNLVASASKVYGAVTDLYFNYQKVDYKKLDSSNHQFNTLYAQWNEPIKTVHMRLRFAKEAVLVPLDMSNVCTQPSLSRMDVLEEYEQLDNYVTISHHRFGYNSEFDWAKQLKFGREHKIVTQQTAYLVLERVEDYINYGITPPKEIEQQVVNDPKYVKRKTQDPIYYATQQTIKERIINIASQYNANYAKYGRASYKSKEDILLDKIKTNQQLQQTAPMVGSDSYVLNKDFDKPTMSSEKHEEVVIVAAGYGTQKKSATAYASVVEERELFTTGNQNVNSLLAGRVAGVHVVQANGMAGSVGEIRIRGISGISGNNTPLYVLDGMPLPEHDALSSININDIQNITVLKGAQAAAIFGSRGVNGVVVIESKKGKMVRPTWSRYKLSSMEDEDYTVKLKSVEKKNVYSTYQNLLQEYGHNINFHIDAATILFKNGDKQLAKIILLSVLELTENINNHVAVAFMLDEFGFFNEAQQIYQNCIFLNRTESCIDYRNLAISQLMSGNVQEAANTYYKAISNSSFDWYHSNNILLEFKALLAAYKNQIDVSNFEIVFSDEKMPEKHVYINSNIGFIHVSKFGNVSSSNFYDYHNMTMNFDTIVGKKDEIAVQCYRQTYGNHGTINDGDHCTLVRIVEFEDFGKSTQRIITSTHNVSNQYGEVVLQKVRY